MSSNPVTSIANSKHGKCADIYADEIKKQINTLINFKETWLRSSADWNTNLFQYADPDFYFFRFAIDRQEKSTEPFLLRVLPRVMERYGIDFEISNDTTFCFIINENGNRHGYRFKDFYREQDVNSILFQSKLDDAFILSLSKPGRADSWIARDNEYYIANGLHLRTETLESFFHHYFGVEEYNDFLQAVNQYINVARENTGYKSIKFFSTMNLATQKAFEQKCLADWQYKPYEFQIIDRQDKRIKKFLYFSPTLFSPAELDKMEENYLTTGLYKAMIGGEEFAESFLTSEWLYYSLKDLQRFDFTAVISGYLKSIEQLLYKIVMINVGNQCRITMSGDSEIRQDAKKHRISIYEWDKKTRSIVPATGWKDNKQYYIDLIPSQVKYMDSSIGTFEYFLRNNPHILVHPWKVKQIADLVSCFRIECRNDYFHTHNLNDWKIVEKVRDNAFYLYYLLLGGCIIPQAKIGNLGLLSSDSFDDLCRRIREHYRYLGEFIFEYADGKKRNVIYDHMNNTIQHTDKGIEHYERLVFYEVEQFGIEAYEQLDKGIREEQIIYLTRDNLPFRILGLYRDGRSEEIPIT